MISHFVLLSRTYALPSANSNTSKSFGILQNRWKFTFQVNPELEKIQEDIDKYFGEDSYDKYRFDNISCCFLCYNIFDIT